MTVLNGNLTVLYKIRSVNHTCNIDI